mmetsp:Transcript_11357/g.12694  ORF Transcript_11357/g.12694 Transcript_11357/m.12694 type:complete len:428 (-) Transcript_11357:19-1302(-)
MIGENNSPRSEQLPSWWLQGVLHDTREEQLRLKRRARREKAGLPPETENEENCGMEEEMRILDTLATNGDITEELIESYLIENSDTVPINSLHRSPIGDKGDDPTFQQNSIIQNEFSEESNSTLKNSLKVGKNTTKEKEEEAAKRRRKLERTLGGSVKLSITMTSEEEAAEVEYRRSLLSTPSQILGPNLLKSRRGNIKTIIEDKDMDIDDEIPEDCLIDNYTLRNNRERATENAGRTSVNVYQGKTTNNVTRNRSSENASQGAVLDNQNRHRLKSVSPVSSKDVIKNASPVSPKSVGPGPIRKHDGLSPVKWSDSVNKKAFVGGSFSHFDFAMQQRALQKERREKERHARESLAIHHGASLELDRAAKLKAKEKEEREKRMEADYNLKSFKAANLNTYTAELKKLQIKDKMKKKEAEENLKGYRVR